MASLNDLLAAMQNGVQAMNALTAQISATFPQASALSTSAPVGTITFTSSQAADFLTVVTSSGATMYAPLYTAT